VKEQAGPFKRAVPSYRSLRVKQVPELWFCIAIAVAIGVLVRKLFNMVLFAKNPIAMALKPNPCHIFLKCLEIRSKR
jgi:hypothetical protein